MLVQNLKLCDMTCNTYNVNAYVERTGKMQHK